MRSVAAAAVALLLVVFVARRAAAVEYELPVEIETEDDLYELHEAGEISDETFDTLVELLRKGVDLNTADEDEIYALPGLTLAEAQAVVTYRTAAGGIPDPGGLVAGGVLGADKLLAIAPFLIVSQPKTPSFSASGRARYRALVTAGDGRVPAMSLEARAAALRHLTVGLDLFLTRNAIGDVRYDPTRGALSAEPRATRPQLAKIYAMWRTGAFEIIAGSFNAGFGQALTFDDSPVYLPNGLYRDDAIYRSTDLVSGCIESSGEVAEVPCPSDPKNYVSPDFRSRQGLFGLGLRAKKLRLGGSWIELTGFASRSVRDIYQYEIYDRAKCSDPNDDSAEECKAPPVFKREDMPLDPSTKFRYVTLPSLWAEVLGGGNASLWLNRRAHVGVTGWGAKPTWLTDGLDLDFQEWSTYPRNGAYGAIGGDASWGMDWFDLGLEATRTFDRVAGGDFGVLARGTATFHKSELEVSARYYGENFVNPHTGAIAEPDEVDGQRARDEAGVRLRYGGKLSRRVALRGLLDVWRQPSEKINKVRAEVRGDYLFTRDLRAGLYFRFQDKDLSASGPDECYETSFAETEDGEPIGCKGQKAEVGLVGTYHPIRRMDIGVQGQFRNVDASTSSKKYDSPRKDVLASVKLNWWPTDLLRVRARARYEVWDVDNMIADTTFLEDSLWAYAALSYRLPRQLTLTARYDIRAYLNEAQRSYVRTPAPEHWFQMEIEAKF